MVVRAVVTGCTNAGVRVHISAVFAKSETAAGHVQIALMLLQASQGVLDSSCCPFLLQCLRSQLLLVALTPVSVLSY